MDSVTVWTLVILGLISLMVAGFFVIRCLTQGKDYSINFEWMDIHKMAKHCSSLTVLRAADGSSLAVLKAADGSKQPSLLPSAALSTVKLLLET